MQKEFLQNIFTQNQMTCSFAFNKISNENIDFRLNKQAASVGFIYRHIGETINLFATFLGYPTDVQNTTMGETDRGQGKNLEESRNLINKGYDIWQQIIDTTPDEEWLGMIDTPFFGKVTRLRLFSHVLFHNSHHCGQISLTLSKGSNIP
jgi:uncharacterized damage-inducible protein DinB